MTTAETCVKSNASGPRAIRAGGRVGVQQAIEQDFGDDDEDAGVGIDAAIAGDEADVVGLEAPAHGRLLHLVKLLFGQGDERRGVIDDAAGVQRLEESGLGDERLAGAGRAQTRTPCSAVNQASKSVFLDGIGRVRKLGEVAFGQVVARRHIGGHSGYIPSTEASSE